MDPNCRSYWLKTLHEWRVRAGCRANRRGIAAMFIMRKADDFQERITPAFEELLAQ